jgi:hypothetical protein
MNLEFDQWLDKYEEDVNIELAEQGYFEELDFDLERELENRYEKYLKTN